MELIWFGFYTMGLSIENLDNWNARPTKSELKQ